MTQGLAHVSQQKMTKERDLKQGGDGYFFSQTPRAGGGTGTPRPMAATP